MLLGNSSIIGMIVHIIQACLFVGCAAALPSSADFSEEAMRMMEDEGVGAAMPTFLASVFPESGQDAPNSPEFNNIGVALMRGGGTRKQAAMFFSLALALDPFYKPARDHLRGLMDEGENLCFWKGNIIAGDVATHGSKVGILHAERGSSESLCEYVFKLQPRHPSPSHACLSAVLSPISLSFLTWSHLVGPAFCPHPHPVPWIC